MHPLLTNHLPAINQVFQENGVKRAYAFGEDSDVDILIDFEENLDPITYGENYFKIVVAIETILGRMVDLVTARTLRNPYFIKVINQTKTVIYE